MQIEVTDQAIQQIQDTRTNALMYWTVYPKAGLDSVSDDILKDLVVRIQKGITATGQPLFLRYAPEMNGNWFAYGQQPEKFREHWIRVVKFIRSSLGSNATMVSFIWAPNSSNGYPFYGGQFQNDTFMATLSKKSDPFSIYYPGDDYVDWVGLSIYHYGVDNKRANSIPFPNEFEAYIRGNYPPPKGEEWPLYDFYGMFSEDGKGSLGQLKPSANVSNGGKPFIVAETGATYHYGWGSQWSKQKDYNASRLAPNATGPSRLEIKQEWWTQIFSFASTHPKFKAVCSFEFIKAEEDTLRDFTMFGAPGPSYVAGFGVEDGVVVDAFSKFVNSNGNGGTSSVKVKWASALDSAGPSITTTSSATATSTKTSDGYKSRMISMTHKLSEVVLFLAMIITI
jgi:hypothetical protein